MCNYMCIHVWRMCRCVSENNYMLGSRFRVLYNFELRLNLRPAIQRSSFYIYIHTHIRVVTVLLSPLFVCDYLFA